jgi:hypothetical protein
VSENATIVGDFKPVRLASSVRSRTGDQRSRPWVTPRVPAHKGRGKPHSGICATG